MGKVAALKIPYGLRDGQLVHVSSVGRGDSCDSVCVGCEQPLAARKGNLKVHHFAHSSVNPSCSRESVLHILGKRLLRERIEKALERGVALPMQWKCEACVFSHQEDLVKKAQSVSEEFDMGEARADLVLINQQGRPYIACEIVVTHEPEEAVKTFYKSQKITCVEIHVSSEKHLEMLASGYPIIASKVDHCPTPSCECGAKLFPRSIYVIDSNCVSCRKSIKVSYGYFGNGPMPPSAFKPEEIIFARKQGVRIERRYRPVVRRSCFLNLCSSCDHPWDDGAPFEITLQGPSHDVLWWCGDCDRTRPVVGQTKSPRDLNRRL